MVLGGQRQVVLVRPAGTILVLQVLHYPEQVRACPRRAPARPERNRQSLWCQRVAPAWKPTPRRGRERT